MKSTKNELTPKAEDLAPDSAMPVVVASKKKRPSKRAIRIALLTVAAVFVAAVLVIVTLKFIEDRKSITVGDTTFTHQQQTEYADQLNKNLKKTGNSIDKSVNDTTYDTLLLNAALKDQAKQHNIVVTQADIDASLKDDYAAYGGKAQYDAAIKANGTDKITPIINENNVYESKLESILLTQKDLFYVSIYYDSPYFNNSKDPAALRAQAVQHMKDKYLPLFESGASKDEIASKADVSYLDNKASVPGDEKQFYTGMPAVANYVANYGRSRTFNDQSGDKSIPGAVNTNGLAIKLQAEGEHTDVVTTLSGWIGIMRAEKVGGGNYVSWDALLKEYKLKQESKKIGVLKPVNHIARQIATITKQTGSVVNRLMFPKAYAVNCAAHSIKLVYHVINKTTGAGMSGAALHYSRSSSNCPGAITGSQTFPLDGNTTINDNCYAPAPSVWISDPNNYHRASPFTSNDSNNDFEADGTLRWTVGHANEAASLNVTLNYLPDIRFNMAPDSWGPSNSSPAPGETITFHHRVYNTGPNATNVNISGQVKWTSGTASTGGYGSPGGAVTNSGNTDYNRQFAVGLGDARLFDVPFPVPRSAQNGDRFCQFVTAQPTAQDNSSTSSSQPACATVQVPNTPPTGNITIQCIDAATSKQLITYGFDDVDGSGSVKGRIGKNGNTGDILSASQGTRSGVLIILEGTRSDPGGNSYSLEVQNVDPGGSMGNWLNRGTVVSPPCVPPTPHPPTGGFSMQCTDDVNHKQRIYGIYFSDSDGSTDRKILRAGSVIDGPNTSTADITNITDTGGTLYQMQVKDVTGSSYVTVFSMNSPNCVSSSTPTPSTIYPGASITNGTVSVGDYVTTSTGVNLQGPNTHSNWSRTFWYDNNNNSTYESGTDNSITSDSQSNYYYSSPYTSLPNSPATTVASGKTRICIQLNLSNPTANDSGASTSIISNPSVDCRSISSAPPALVIYPQVSLSGAATVAPGDVITPTNMVIKTGGTALATSNWARSYWYDTNGNGSYDSGEPAAVSSVGATQNGSGTYSTSSTSVGSNAAATVNGAYNRLCVQLTLSNPNSGTTINPTTAVACKPIQQPAIGLKIEVTLTAADGSTEFEPGTTVNATAKVTNPSTTDLAGSVFNRYFWYETNGDDNTADSPYIDSLYDLGYFEPATTTEAGPTWTTQIPPSGSIPTRICTSLTLDLTQMFPVGTTTVPADGKRTVCASIAMKPYVRVQLGDVFAGGTVPGATGVCPSAGAGTISTYNKGATGSYAGSGTQIAAYARGAIDGFTSKGVGYPAILPSGKELTFANVDASQTYGGNSALTYCSPNYWDGAGGGDVTVNASSADITKTTGNAYVTSSKNPSIAPSGKVTGLQWVIADNIYIDKNVGSLSGVYIARKNIYTCSNGNGSPVQISNMASQCNRQLTVTGAVVAGGDVKLMRTSGFLTSTPAETFVYNPFVWLSGTSGATPFGTAGNKYDYITALPPVL